MDMGLLAYRCDLLALLIDGSWKARTTPFGLQSGFVLDLRGVHLHLETSVKQCWAILESVEPWIIFTSGPVVDRNIQQQLKRLCVAFS